MFIWFCGYLIASLVAAGMLTMIVGLVRPVKKLDEFLSWRWLAAFFVLSAVAPYSYSEILTRWKGDGMSKPLTEALQEAEVEGKLNYYKIYKVSDKTAHVVACAADQNEWGYPERVIFKADLVMGKKGWELKEFEVLNSEKRQLDGNFWPPYF